MEEAGGTWVILDQVESADLQYDGKGQLTQGVTPLGSLDETAAKYVRVNTWHDSNKELKEYQSKGLLAHLEEEGFI